MFAKYLAVSEKWLNFADANGWIPEWPNGADCKSAGLRLRWFESISTHITKEMNFLTTVTTRTESTREGCSFFLLK